MINLLVEIKNEYTNHLTYILSPLIFEGIQSIYNEAKNIVKNNGENNHILKIFQSCLKSIVKWNQNTIDNETNRIIRTSNIINQFNDDNNEWLNDLVKATLKSHIMVLMYNQNKINPEFYKNIKLSYFIHRVYIECAIELWNNPYLLYHEYPNIEIKRNHRECIIIIKECIKESIRKLLPVKHILKFYLNEDIDINNINNDKIGKSLSDIEENYLTKLIYKDLYNNNNNNNKFCLNFNDKKIKKNSDKLSSKKNSDKKIKKNNSKSSKKNSDNTFCLSIKSNNTNNTNNNSNNNSNNNTNNTNNNTNNNINNNDKSKETIILDIINKESSFSNISKLNHLDSKIKNILVNDLAINESDTSLLNTHDNEYQAIFSNSNISYKKN